MASRVMGLAEAINLPQLSAEEECRLAVATYSGDAAAREQLILHLTGLVMSLSNHFAARYPTMEQEDLFSEGMAVAIQYGVDRYDPTNGLRLSTWVGLAVRRKLTLLCTNALRPPAVPEMEESLPPHDVSAAYELELLLRSLPLHPQDLAMVTMLAQGMSPKEMTEQLSLTSRQVLKYRLNKVMRVVEEYARAET